MKKPPTVPPVTKTPAKNDDEWDDALGDRAGQTVSPDVVRKLLEMNPALREQGMNTSSMVNEVQRAHSTKQKPATLPPTNDIFTAFDGIKGALADEKERIENERKRLKLEEQKAIVQAKERVTRWITNNDPDMRSPVTQRVLKNEEAFLKAVGFSVEGYVDERTKR